MASYGDIIPISSRRRGPPADGPNTTRRGPLPVLLFLVVLVAIGAIGMFLQSRAREAARSNAAEARQAIFSRAYLDLVKTCTLPDAARGPVREHCLQQAKFVLQLPECGPVCVKAARAIEQQRGP